MAALPAGVSYNLLSESTYLKNKELVYVKLTDSALKTIEDYLRNNTDLLGKPKIQFLPGNTGKFIIPTPPNKTANDGIYFFSEYKKEEETQHDGKPVPVESQECVRQCGPKRLESCGQFLRKLRVQATDDSYEATKNRMAKTVAAEQSKCTRVIKPNQTDIGRRVKVRSSHQLFSSSSAAAQLSERNERSERSDRQERPERPEKSERQERPERIERIERPERPERLEKSERPERIERPDRPERPTAAPPILRPQTSQPTHQMHQQMHQQLHPHQPQRPPPNPDLTKRPLKERLIQLLALKSFKKPEIYTRLNSEGLKDRERCMVNKILSQIASLKDNCYQLRRHVWNDVNEDWPFYTEEEKRLLKRRKPQNLTPPLSSDSTNSLSPRASPSATKRTSACLGSSNNSSSSSSISLNICNNGSTGNSINNSNSSNNNALSNVEDAPATKKQRISHYRRPSPPSSGYATGSSGASSGERHASDNEDDRTSTVKKDNGYTLSFNTVKELCPSPVKSNGYRNSPPIETSNNSTVKEDITNSEPLENTESTSVPEENDFDDFQRQYPRITSVNMRRAYKNEFSDLYSEYQTLYRRVANVAARFTELEQELKNAEPHSPYQQSIEQRIVEEYRRMRNDTGYQHDRRRVNYLHRKLNHLKQMVNDFDKEHSLKPERVSAASTTQAY